LNQDGAIDYSQINMDVNGDGVLDRTAWTGPQDGVLVWDQFHNGQVVSSSQYAFSQYGGATDLSGLAAGFDTNHDGLFDASDAKFSEFAAWQDSNQNGVSDAGEVLSLASLGITSINLVSDGTVHSPSAGVQVLGQSHATLANGGQMLVDDAKFTYRPLTLNELVQPDHDAELAKLVADAPAVAPVSASSLMTQIMLDQELLLASHA
jgi:large repetitive protein